MGAEGEKEDRRRRGTSESKIHRIIEKEPSRRHVSVWSVKELLHTSSIHYRTKAKGAHSPSLFLQATHGMSPLLKREHTCYSMMLYRERSAFLSVVEKDIICVDLYWFST
jgi:hypothetical protein